MGLAIDMGSFLRGTDSDAQFRRCLPDDFDIFFELIFPRRLWKASVSRSFNQLPETAVLSPHGLPVVRKNLVEQNIIK
jgi:hypothetical protein